MCFRDSLAIAASAAVIATLGLADTARADIAIEIGAPGLLGPLTSLNPLAPGSLLQLIDLGADGLFNPIRVDVGGRAWVSGDDRLLLVSFATPSGSGDFGSAAAFDLSVGVDTPGELSRVFVFSEGVIQPGTKLGLRWFPGLSATGFGAGLGVAAGQAYGEFTRQSALVNGGELWVAPNNGTVTFDPLVPISQGGGDPESAAIASHTVTAVPEPASAVAVLTGAAILLARRRRVRSGV